MNRFISIAVIICFSGIGCVAMTDTEPTNESEVPPPLTPETARIALIELINSKSCGDLEDFPMERYIHMAAESGENSGSWGPFRFDLTAQKYFFEKGRNCRFSYEGSFELRDGMWVALTPRWTMVACSKDKD